MSTEYNTGELPIELDPFHIKVEDEVSFIKAAADFMCTACRADEDQPNPESIGFLMIRVNSAADRIMELTMEHVHSEKGGAQCESTGKPAWTQFDRNVIADLSNDADALELAHRVQSMRPEEREIVKNVLGALSDTNKEAAQ